VTDTPEEFEALKAFLKTYPIHMIQWRNLNFDPLRYRQIMRKVAEQGPSIGMHYILKRLCQDFPTLRHGYFNPPKESFVLSKA
jgi:hypothetical protein